MVYLPKPDTAAASTIRLKLAHQELPSEMAARMWAGRGSGQLCDGCGEPIADEVEYELEFTGSEESPRTLRLHRSCCEAWNVERVALFSMDGCSYVRSRRRSL
jgi:hypothetical protein